MVRNGVLGIRASLLFQAMWERSVPPDWFSEVEKRSLAAGGARTTKKAEVKLNA